jgi:hypothetical protein
MFRLAHDVLATPNAALAANTAFKAIPLIYTTPPRPYRSRISRFIVAYDALSSYCAAMGRSKTGIIAGPWASASGNPQALLPVYRLPRANLAMPPAPFQKVP